MRITGNSDPDSYNVCCCRLNKRLVQVAAATTVGLAALLMTEEAQGAMKSLREYSASINGVSIALASGYYLCYVIMLAVDKKLPALAFGLQVTLMKLLGECDDPLFNLQIVAWIAFFLWPYWAVMILG